MIDVVLIGESSGFSGDLLGRFEEEQDLQLTLLRGRNANKESREQAEKAAVLIVGPSLDINEASKRLDDLTGSWTDRAIKVAHTIDADVLRQALRAGFRDVVSPDHKEIIGAIRRVHDLTETAETPGEQKTGDRDGRIITFLSAKGGVGKTMALTNTAVGLATRNGQEVLVLDLDEQFGDVGVMLGLKPDRTVSDLMQVVDRLDSDMLESFLTKHQSGASILLAPVDYQKLHPFSDEQLDRILEAARVTGDIVLVDTPVSFSQTTLSAIKNSDLIFVVTTLDVPSIKSAKIALQTLEFLKFPMKKVKVLLNRADSKVSLTPKDVERHLKHKIAVKIPSDRAVPRSVNEGTTVLQSAPNTPVTEALIKIVDLVQEFQITEDREQAKNEEMERKE